MSYYHVIAKTTKNDKYFCLFADLSATELVTRLVKPYEKGTTFFSGSDLHAPTDLSSLKIVKTERPDQVERDDLNQKDRENIDEINRSSPHVTFISAGGGYDAEDIEEAGDDVTQSFIKGPPGFKANRFTPPLKVLGWIGGVAAAVIATGIAKWLGWV